MSTEAQLKGDSLRRQLDLSAKYAAAHDLALADDFELKDFGVSAFTGENITSGAMGKFLAAVRERKIAPGSYLLVESLDRISRQHLNAALSQFLEIINSGIVLVTLADNRQYTPQTIKMEDLLVSIIIMSRAHEESATKSFRVRAAWSNKRANVKDRKLTARCPAWLELSSDRKTFGVIKARAEIIARIFDEAASGIGAYTIARRLNQEGVPTFVGRNGWHTSSINKILTNRAVLGEFQPHRLIDGQRRMEGEPIPGYFPKIVEFDTFHAVQAARSTRRVRGGGRRGENVSNLFSKLARCHYCRGPMRCENKGTVRSLVCDNAVRGRKCKAIRWPYQDFEVAFLAIVEELQLGSFFSTNQQSNERAEVSSRIKALTSLLAEKTAEREKTFALVRALNVDIPFVAEKLRACETAISSYQSELTDLEKKLSNFQSETQSYYKSRSDLKELVLTAVGSDNPNSYKLRSAIATHLRSLLVSLTLAPAGNTIGKTTSLLHLINYHHSIDKGAASFKFGKDRYFVAIFRDGKSRTVYPSDSDPFECRRQILSGGRDLNYQVISGSPPN